MLPVDESIALIRLLRRKSLNFSGAVAGLAVMTLHIAVGYRYGAVLLVFFFTSSKLTKVGEDKKHRVDQEFKEGGQRSWIQVLSNAGISSVLVVVLWRLTGLEERCLDSKESALITALMGGVIGHFSCCNGDTWSSELGILSDDQPRLITNFKWDLQFWLLGSLGNNCCIADSIIDLSAFEVYLKMLFAAQFVMRRCLPPPRTGKMGSCY